MSSRLLLTFVLIAHSISGMSQEEVQSKSFQGQDEISIPTYLYIILSKDAWEENLQKEALSLGPEHEPFIHLSTEEQISRISEKFFKGIEHVVLKIETKKMQGHLVYESNPGGTNKYFHLYDGVIPLDAVEAMDANRSSIIEKLGR